MRRGGRPSVASFGVFALLFLAAASSRANGVFPAVSQIVTEPGEPDHVFLRSTFGLVVSSDRGASWDWICESAAGYVDIEPAMTVLEGGRVILGLPRGISRSSANACDFAPAAGIDANVVDVSRVTGDPERVVALSVTDVDSQVWESTDAGETFAPLGEPLLDFRATTLDVPATEHGWIYVSGFAGVSSGTGEGRLLRSEDRGLAWQSFGVPETTSARRPYIAAVDPEHAATVYVRTEGLPGLLFVTRDGGETLEEVLRLKVPIQGFALSPDGKSVLATNVYDGAFRADVDSLVFEKVACRGPSCLSWTESGLFGCGDDTPDGFIIGASEDEGATFERVIDLSCIRGPLACESSTLVGGECPLYWPAIQTQLGAEVCAPRDVPPYRGCMDMGEAGADGTGGTGADNQGGAPSNAGDGALGGATTAGTGAAPSNDGGATPSAPAESGREGSSGCSLSTSRNSWLFLAVLGFFLGSARRRATRERRRPNEVGHEPPARRPSP
ncbi:MAG TPA: hypothetical protein VGK73_07050 [Polyangiaceae bacterium]